MKQMLVHLMLSQRPLRLSSFHSFFFILLLSSYHHHSIFRLTHLFCFSYSVDWSGIFFISVIVLFITICVCFSSSRSLLNISSVFLIHAPILFLRFWIIFTISTLNSFSGRLAISSSLIWSLVITLLLHLYHIFGCLFFFLIRVWSVFLSCSLFGLRHPALEFTGSWVELGVGTKMGTSGGSVAD